MPGQSRRKKMSFLRTLQKQGALWPCVAFIILCWFSARMVKSCEDDICPCSSTLEDDMYVRADELYCLLKLMWISEKPTDFLSVETLTLKSLLEETTCFQPGRWCCCVGSTHTQWPAYAPWALGYRRTWFLVWYTDTFWHVYYCVLVMQLHTIYGRICAFLRVHVLVSTYMDRFFEHSAFLMPVAVRTLLHRSVLVQTKVVDCACGRQNLMPPCHHPTIWCHMITLQS